MHITEGIRDHYNIYENDSGIEFYDCEEFNQGIDYNDDIYYELSKEIPEPTVPLTEDLKHSLFHLIKILTSYEADRFSLSMLYKAGLGIPLSVLTAAHSFYRAWARGENIGTVLIAEFPFFVQTILPHSGKLMLLAKYIRNYIEDQLGIDGLSFTAGYDNRAESAYLGLGILALMGKFYLAGHTVPEPERAGFNIPLVLARLFTRICQYWNILCASTVTDDTPPADEFGRIVLSQGEKRAQTQGRKLARLWAKDIRRPQIQVERIAESFYAIGKPAWAAKTAGLAKNHNHHHQALSRLKALPVSAIPLSALTTSVRRLIQGLGRAAASALTPFPAVGAATLNLSSDAVAIRETITVNPLYGNPGWKTPDVLFERLLQKNYPTLAKTLAKNMTQAIGTRFGILLNPDDCYLHRFDSPSPDPESPTGWGHKGEPVHSISLTDFALKKYFTDEFADPGVLDRYYSPYRGNWSAPDEHHRFRLPFTPSDLAALLDCLDIKTAHLHELDRYWRGNHEFHALANLINLLTQLIRHQERLQPGEVETFMQALGFSDTERHPIKIYLFDIADYISTDLLIIETERQHGILLYLPRAQLPFRRFENSTAMREWIGKQGRDNLCREEIADHFALRDRPDSGFIFVKWGADRWLRNIADYPERFWQKKECRSGTLYEILTEQQRLRSLADAEYLPLLRQSLTGEKEAAATAWINQHYASAITRSSTPAQGKDELVHADDTPGRPRPIAESPRLALSLLTACAGEILPLTGDGGIHFLAGPKISLSLFQSIINHDMRVKSMSRRANAGEMRIVETLSVTPTEYVRTLRRWPNGRTDMHFSVTLPPVGKSRRENITAIHLFDNILPLRFNAQLKAYEVYDIHHEATPGYPVCHSKSNHWQFGRITGQEYNIPSAVFMAEYSYVSIRLYKKIMEHVNDLCKNINHLGPANSLGIAQDAEGVEYLTLKDHYFKMTPSATEGIFFLRGDHKIRLKIKFDRKKKRFVYIPGYADRHSDHDKLISTEELNNGTDSRLGYRQGFRAADNKASRLALAVEKKLIDSGLKKIIYYGLSDQEILSTPRYAQQANAVRHGFTRCGEILRELLAKKKRLPESLWTVLGITGAGENVRHRACALFMTNLEKTAAQLEKHVGDDYRQVWAASFDSFTTAMIILKSDPLQRLWVNVRFRQPKRQRNHYLAQYCHYGCKEIPIDENIASISRSVGNNGNAEGQIFVHPVYKRDFPALVERLMAGNMNNDEINSLVGFSEAASIRNLIFLSDKELARQLFSTNATVRVKMLLNDADMFSHLLLHLHAAFNNRSCDHPYQDPHLRMVLFMMSWQAL